MNGDSRPKLRRRLLELAVFLTCASCGNGGILAGIEGTGIVSGFGSVFVNGIEFDTAETEFVFNGMPATEDSLRAGDIVRFVGELHDDGARATLIEFDRFVDGPIGELVLDDGVGTLTALGQAVRIDENTRFINTGPAQLAVGDLIAVSGLLDGDGVLRATSLQEGPTYMPGITLIDIEGFVRDLDVAAGRFEIGELVVDFSDAVVTETAGPLESGAFVQAAGVQGAEAGAPLIAAAVEVRTRSIGQPGEEVSIDAVITNFAGLDDFRLNGQPVDAATAERTDNATLAPADGVRVQVRGFVRDGTVIADTLSVYPPPSFQQRGEVQAVAADANSFTLDDEVLGVTESTVYLDSSAAADRRFRIDALQPGDSIEAAGFADADGAKVVTRLQRTAVAP